MGDCELMCCLPTYFEVGMLSMSITSPPFLSFKSLKLMTSRVKQFFVAYLVLTVGTHQLLVPRSFFYTIRSPLSSYESIALLYIFSSAASDNYLLEPLALLLLLNRVLSLFVALVVVKAFCTQFCSCTSNLLLTFNFMRYQGQSWGIIFCALWVESIENLTDGSAGEAKIDYLYVPFYATF